MSYWNFLFINITLLENYDFSSKILSINFTLRDIFTWWTDCFSQLNSSNSIKKSFETWQDFMIAEQFEVEGGREWRDWEHLSDVSLTQFLKKGWFIQIGQSEHEHVVLEMSEPEKREENLKKIYWFFKTELLSCFCSSSRGLRVHKSGWWEFQESFGAFHASWMFKVKLSKRVKCFKVAIFNLT